MTLAIGFYLGAAFGVFVGLCLHAFFGGAA